MNSTARRWEGGPIMARRSYVTGGGVFVRKPVTSAALLGRMERRDHRGLPGLAALAWQPGSAGGRVA